MLSWLPEHPDLGRALSGARAIADPMDRLRAAVRLAGHDRDVVATGRVDRLAGDGLRGGGPDGIAANGLSPLRIAVLSSHTVDHLIPAIRVAGLNHRMALSIHVGAYGLYRQALLNGDPELADFAPQLVVLALDMAAVLPGLPLGTSQDEVEAAVAAAVEDLRLLWRQIRARYGAQPVQQTLVDPSPSLFGSFDGLVPASPASLCARLNAAIRSAAREDGALLLDVDWQLPPRWGEAERVDPVRWHQAKQLVNPTFAPLYGDLVARVAAALAGRSRKCLVLDLDNTVWGGVVGDDGVEGIRLGQGSAEGEAFLAFQRYAARLAERGVILAVCSKNDDAVARAAFDQHPEMALRHSDIACFVANWTDKATNLREIARRINIGTDSLVFVDDNPAERALVRRELPEVAVPELPDDVSYYAARIAQAGYFEAASLTGDDLSRSRSYAANAQRAAAMETATDMDGYLRSLEMRLTVREIGPIDRPRAAQLINKSNQFNLTTRRRTEQELEALLKDPSALGYGFRLSDRFGDNGLISVILARPDAAWPDDDLLIDTWLMSCRVLGRGVEAAALATLAKAAIRRGAAALIGEYRPSGRNGMVASHYERLGFSPVETPSGAAADARFWRLPLAGADLPTPFIAVELIQ
ncbi:HAD family hydrolase [uncultured Paracoccus sp.]|uniref:HAD-IIIC family phosphatase n=1 Tax=uncultured Paracoccus sp. TaxID=189685 RepID=UPI00261269C5|nr:HAD-IIIC family phosphatase [uncultured Paracoccus sp.]